MSLTLTRTRRATHGARDPHSPRSGGGDRQCSGWRLRRCVVREGRQNSAARRQDNQLVGLKPAGCIRWCTSVHHPVHHTMHHTMHPRSASHSASHSLLASPLQLCLFSLPLSAAAVLLADFAAVRAGTALRGFDAVACVVRAYAWHTTTTWHTWCTACANNGTSKRREAQMHRVSVCRGLVIRRYCCYTQRAVSSSHSPSSTQTT